MTDERQKILISFITEQMSAVRDPDEIYEELKVAGWPEDHIREAFLALHTQVLPKAVREHTAVEPSAAVPAKPEPPLPKAGGERHGGWASLKRMLTGGKRGSGRKSEDDVHPAPPV